MTVAAQLRKQDLPSKTYIRFLSSTVQVDQWIDLCVKQVNWISSFFALFVFKRQRVHDPAFISGQKLAVSFGTEPDMVKIAGFITFLLLFNVRVY